ncbi:MAG TPA: hypothetical protein VJN89_18395 [Candidatus Acidoferrum sp.]|nr:hypothetical protein [Candidatus Acidoferrum sp.]
MGDRSKSRGVGPVDTKLAEQNCSERACHSAAATSLDHQALCLNHFLLRCYAQLEAVDPRAQKSREQRVELAAMRAFIEECSQKTLEVCLQREDLTNLERARLLDILLWASELFLVLRAPRVTFGDFGASPSAPGTKRMASSV